MERKLSLSPSKLYCTFYNDLFVLKTAVTINGQPAEIEFSGSGEIKLKCRYPEHSFSFGDGSTQLRELLRNYGACQVSSIWFDAAAFVHVTFASEHGLRTFLGAKLQVEVDLACLFSQRLAEACSPALACDVETELFLIAPNAKQKEANIIRVTEDNCSECLSILNDSDVFDFGSLFREYQFNRGHLMARDQMTLLKLVEELDEVPDWFHLGIYLDIPHFELLTIERDHRGQTRRCRLEMLQWWLANAERPSWSAVVRALNGIRKSALAKKIAIKYGTTLSQEPLTLSSNPITMKFSTTCTQALDGIEERTSKLAETKESIRMECQMLGKRSIQEKEKLSRLTQDKEKLSKERSEAKRQLEFKEKELHFLRTHQDTNEALRAIIEAKEANITHLKKQIAQMESHLDAMRDECKMLRSRLEETDMELAKQSERVRELERTQASLDRERIQVDARIIAEVAKNEGVTLCDTDGASTAEEADSLKEDTDGHEDKQEDEIGSEMSDEQGETGDGRMRQETPQSRVAEVEHKENVPDPQQCIVVFPYSQPQKDSVTHFELHLRDASGKPCYHTREVSVTGHLKCLSDESTAEMAMEHHTQQGISVLSCKPAQRGIHQLIVSVNGTGIADSPFSVSVEDSPATLGVSVSGEGSSLPLYIPGPTGKLGHPIKIMKGLKYTRRMAITGNKQLVVTGSEKISVWDLEGKLINSLRVGDQGMEVHFTGIAVNMDGVMFVADSQSCKIFKVSFDGELLKSSGGKGNGPGQFNFPDGITLASNKVYVCDVNNHRVQIFDTDLNLLGFFGNGGSGKGEFNYPCDLASDREGHIYVAESRNHRVQVFTMDGTFLRAFGKQGSGPGKLNYPTGIYVHHDLVYITENGNKRVSIFTTSGRIVSSSVYVERRRWLKGIVVDDNGYIYVCDYSNGCVCIFSVPYCYVNICQPFC